MELDSVNMIKLAVLFAFKFSNPKKPIKVLKLIFNTLIFQNCVFQIQFKVFEHFQSRV